MTTKDEWVAHCVRLSRRGADLWSGSVRKIIRHYRATFHEWDHSLSLDHVGFTSAKMRQLERLYLNDEARDTAVQLWERLRSRAKYGSASFSTCNHLVKSGVSVDNAEEKRSKHGSIQGPCMQSVIITWLSKDRVWIDVPYRSTEIFKKFPADLVFLRDLVLAPFDFTGMEITVSCDFCNLTVHPMYFVTIYPHLDDPLSTLEDIRERDLTLHRHIVTHTQRITCCPRKARALPTMRKVYASKSTRCRSSKVGNCVSCRNTCAITYDRGWASWSALFYGADRSRLSCIGLRPVCLLDTISPEIYPPAGPYIVWRRCPVPDCPCLTSP